MYSCVRKILHLFLKFHVTFFFVRQKINFSAPLLNLNQTKYPATTTQTKTNRYSNRDAYITDKRFSQRHTATAAETTAVTNPAAEDAADAAAAASRSRQRRRQQRTAEVPSTADASTTDASLVASPATVRPLTTFLQQTPPPQGNRR
jgi:hypothetical protein